MSFGPMIAIPFSWLALIASLYCHVRYDATLQKGWQASAAFIGILGGLGTAVLFNY